MRISYISDDSHRFCKLLVFGHMEEEIIAIFFLFLWELYTVYPYGEILHLSIGIGDRIPKDSVLLGSDDKRTSFVCKGIEI